MLVGVWRSMTRCTRGERYHFKIECRGLSLGIDRHEIIFTAHLQPMTRVKEYSHVLVGSGPS